MPPEIVAQIEFFVCDSKEDSELIKFKIDNDLLPQDKRNAEQYETWIIYELIKSIADKVEHFDEKIEVDIDFIKLKDNKLFKEIEGPENNFIWDKEQVALSEVILRKKIRNDEPLWAIVDNLQLNEDKNFAVQAFEKLDFPEKFLWAKDGLLALEKMIQTNKNKQYVDELVNYFEINNGILIIDENDIDSSSNLLGSANGVAYCSVSSGNLPIMGIYADKIGRAEHKNILPHELTHVLDGVLLDEVETERFADMDIMKLAFMAISMENSPSAKSIIKDVTGRYKKAAYYDETLARIMEHRDFSDSKLLTNLKRLAKAYTKAKIYNHNGIIKHIKTCVKRNLPNYPKQMDQLEQKITLPSREDIYLLTNQIVEKELRDILKITQKSKNLQKIDEQSR